MMTRLPQENVRMGWGILFLIIAVRIMLEHDNVAGLIAGGWLAVIAVSQMVGAIVRLVKVRRHVPFTGVPPLWLAVWVLILGVAPVAGTPHVGITNKDGSCTYIGWNGVIPTWDSGCNLIRYLALNDRLGLSK